MGIYTTDQAAEKLERHPDDVRRWLREGRLRGTKYGSGKGGLWMISPRELERFQRNEPVRRRRSK